MAHSLNQHLLDHSRKSEACKASMKNHNRVEVSCLPERLELFCVVQKWVVCISDMNETGAWEIENANVRAVGKLGKLPEVIWEHEN